MSINNDIRVRTKQSFPMSVIAAMAIASLIVSMFASLIPYTVSAATNLFTDGFESGSFFSWNSADNDWHVTSGSGHAGSKKAQVSDQGVSDDILQKNISTTGYTNITLSYYYRIAQTIESSDHVYVEWWNGSSWHQEADYNNLSSGGWISASHTLSASANNLSDFKFRFRAQGLEHSSGSGDHDEFQLDDVSLVAAGVADTVAPVITINVSSPVEATGTSGAPIAFSTSANEALSGPITCTPISGSTFPLGVTTITCSATDTSGNTGSASATVIVEDTTPPVISITGDEEIFLSVGDEYVEEGATATDLVDPNPQVEICDGEVNTLVPGIYYITYCSSDQDDNESDVSRVITVSDNNAPEVTVTPEAQPVEATGASGAAVSYSVSAIDYVDGDLTGSATCNIASGAIFPIGNTTITCQATDSNENVGYGAATITVVDTTAPVITLVGDASVSADFGSTYSDAGATATDIVDGDVSVAVGGDIVDTNTPGTYTIIYNAVDTHGNHAVEVTRAVTIGPAPVENTEELCTDGIDNDNDEAIDLADEDCAAFIPAPVDENPSDNNNGGNGGGNGGGGVVVGTGPLSIGFVNTNPNAPVGQVLGASTELPAGCSAYLNTYLKKGMKNEEVKKLQTFLNEHMGLSLPVTGIFGQLTFDAVSKFQAKYADEILKPWFEKGLSNDMNPSGFAYKMTIYKINLLQCASLNAPVPQLP